MKPNITFTDEDRRFFTYCGKDSAVTKEIRDRHLGVLTGPNFGPGQLTHYRGNVANLSPMLYMELRGIRYDKAKAEARRLELRRQLNIAQARLNLVSGYRLPWKSGGEILAAANKLMGRKRVGYVTFANLADNPLKPYIEDAKALHRLMLSPTPDLATIGEIETLCHAGLNVDGDEFETYLYETLQLPPQFNEDKITKKKTLTTDYEALLRLSKECIQSDNKNAGEVVRLAIEIRALSRRAGMLEISSDRDGRVRCGYNIVGTYTGRISSYTSPTGSGYNLQTIPNYTNRAEAPGGILGDRDLFIADEDHWFFQCDLKGADGWTVAAYCKMLGDPTMLDDYSFGLKPHNIMTLMLRGTRADYHNREELLYLTHKDRFDKDAWDVFACKRVFHGGNYLEGGLTISRNILKDSEGKLWMSPKECEQLRDHCMFARYRGVKQWHYYGERKIKECRNVPFHVAASGQKCYFFNRPNEIITKWLAFEPQANTTYATNMAMLNLWRDQDNRGGLQAGDMPSHARQLRIEPLHQVHDALCGQFNKRDTTWAVNKIKSYFDNPLVIAGQPITIPFDGAYGPSWGETGPKYGGGVI